MNHQTANLLLKAAVLSLTLVLLYYRLVRSGVEDTKDAVGTVIGIDLGTTYSCVGVLKNGRVEIIANDQGSRITPSYVAFTTDGERLIGDSAMNQVTSNPENTIFDVKRMIGRSWNNEFIQHEIKYRPFKVKEKSGKPHIEVAVSGTPTLFAPEQISAMVLIKMKEVAEAYLGEKVTHAVVTVPAWFNNAQRQATKDAGIIASLNVMRIMNEPTAAAIAYGYNKKEGEKNILVFDLGGGSLDVSLLNIDNNSVEVLATNGDTHLGGEDFGQRVMQHLIKLYKGKTGKDIRTDNKATEKLRREVEKAKRALSAAHQTRIEIERFLDGKDFVETLTRVQFEELNMDLFRSTLIPVMEVLEDSDLTKKDIDKIVLVGGSTRIPKVQQLIKEFFDGKEVSRGINPDEAVAYGAAIMGGVLSGAKKIGDFVLLDVNSHTMGIGTVGRATTKLIPRNTLLPVKRSYIFYIPVDYQSPLPLTIHVLEGEGAMAEDTELLRKSDLTALPLDTEVHEIEVMFEIDMNGILEVSAEKIGFGYVASITPRPRRIKIRIDNSRDRLSPADINRMINNAKKYSEKDRKVREKVEARNELEGYAYSLKNQIADKEKLGGKLLSHEDRTAIEEAADSAILWLESNTKAEVKHMKQQKKQLQEKVHPIVSKICARYAPPPGKEGEEPKRSHDEL